MLEFDTERLESRIKHRFGGSAATVSDFWPGDDAPHRSTVSRWLNGNTLPQSPDTLLALAGALDLDPLTLWKFKDENFAKLCSRIVKAARNNTWSSILPALSFIGAFVGPSPDWPPDIEVYYGRPWTTRRFQHRADSARNFYAGVEIWPAQRDEDRDQVWHFAWRDMIDAALWRPYGFVRLRGNELALYSFSGLVHHRILPHRASHLYVETWFGEGAAEFQVVSLHPFELKRTEQVLAEMCVRFGFPDASR